MYSKNKENIKSFKDYYLEINEYLDNINNELCGLKEYANYIEKEKDIKLISNSESKDYIENVTYIYMNEENEDYIDDDEDYIDEDCIDDDEDYMEEGFNISNNNETYNYTDDEFNIYNESDSYLYDKSNNYMDNIWDEIDLIFTMKKYQNIENNVEYINNLIKNMNQNYDKKFSKSKDMFIDNCINLYYKNKNINKYKEYNIMTTKVLENELKNFINNLYNSLYYLYDKDYKNYKIYIKNLILQYYYLVIDNAFTYKSMNVTYDNLNKDNAEIEKTLSFKNNNNKNRK